MQIEKPSVVGRVVFCLLLIPVLLSSARADDKDSAGDDSTRPAALPQATPQTLPDALPDALPATVPTTAPSEPPSEARTAGAANGPTNGPTNGPSTAPVIPPEPLAAPSQSAPKSRSRIVDNAVPNINPANVPKRPAPILELGNPFFGSGNIAKGIEIPTGAVWSPTFIVFGTYQSAFQAFENPAEPPIADQHKPRSEWANRLDLYGNLTLTGTERVLIGIRPFDNAVFARPQSAKYAGYNFSPSDGSEGYVDTFNGRITTLFFEGDLGQIFPKLDPYDTKQLDIGFSVGRQPLVYQDGLFITDDMDAIGITRNNIPISSGANLQITGVYAWNQINRNDGINHGDPGLIGIFTNADVGKATFNLDTAYVLGSSGSGNGIYAALSATQRFGKYNTTFRVLGSKALTSRTPDGDNRFSFDGNGSSASANGVLLFTEISYTLPYVKDLIYLDAYWGIDRYTSAARGPDRGGPLGRVGILFAEQPIGRYGSALSSNPERSVGAALGYQKFLDVSQRKQLILEVGGRVPTDGEPRLATAVGARYQQAFGQHLVIQLDTFAALNEARGPGYGGRLEFRVDF